MDPVDDKIVAAHQWLLDTTQKSRYWWQVNASIGMALATILSYWFSGPSILALVAYIFVGISLWVIMLRLARYSINLVLPRSTFDRLLSVGILVCCVMYSVDFYVTGEPRFLLSLFAILCLFSYLYLYSCGEPKPPKRKAKAATSLSTQH